MTEPAPEQTQPEVPESIFGGARLGPESGLDFMLHSGHHLPGAEDALDHLIQAGHHGANIEAHGLGATGNVETWPGDEPTWPGDEPTWPDDALGDQGQPDQPDAGDQQPEQSSREEPPDGGDQS
jgi:hypothetical protein